MLSYRTQDAQSILKSMNFRLNTSWEDGTKCTDLKMMIEIRENASQQNFY